MDADAQFLNDFQTAVLPFEQWTHAAHIRMAYLVCKSSNNFDEALLKIRQGIQHFNGLHAAKLKVGFHETMTRFWTIVIWNATQKCDSSILNSNDFIDKNSYLLDSSLWKQYYSPTLMFSSDAKRDFIDPDLKPISINNSHITN
ncbi:unnamed protein product [Rotaria sp. Silwood1]|nr:unnamed protein product [Rotaria sp. Silwood1]CAF1581243.1 unnamed protein product [Rotaria sp. Silwood1]CAF3704062.1 unnamed protein product [Rotaria sp. Silwood1]CAF3741548.1 unnamed protein product [Rotaria sp. Silwood1]CAF4912786.1 unnamed protein product [Rotaria sp. Silwood1]